MLKRYFLKDFLIILNSFSCSHVTRFSSTYASLGFKVKKNFSAFSFFIKRWKLSHFWISNLTSYHFYNIPSEKYLFLPITRSHPLGKQLPNIKAVLCSWKPDRNLLIQKKSGEFIHKYLIKQREGKNSSVAP